MYLNMDFTEILQFYFIHPHFPCSFYKLKPADSFLAWFELLSQVLEDAGISLWTGETNDDRKKIRDEDTTFVIVPIFNSNAQLLCQLD